MHLFAYLLDIGTTTLELELCDADGHVLSSRREINPQSVLGKDVISRIRFCSEHGTDRCRALLLRTLQKMLGEIADELGLVPDGSASLPLYVAGNTTMLHIFLGKDVSGLGAFPYTPVFLKAQRTTMPELSLCGIGEVITLPGVSAYVGADTVAGVLACGMPPRGRYNLLCDLGTNAEIALWSREKLIASSAAAGPCFEGGNITCGMPALPGAICAFSLSGDGETGRVETVGNVPAKGICGSALFDIVAALRACGKADRSGFLPDGGFFPLTKDIHFLQRDMRAFQTAKAAVAAGIALLLQKAGISADEVDRLFLAGGFSGGLNVENAAACGLFPAVLAPRAVPVGNSVLPGLRKYFRGETAALSLLDTAAAPDLSLEDGFQAAFLKNIDFEDFQ